jgi:hypothetical protein
MRVGGNKSFVCERSGLFVTPDQKLARTIISGVLFINDGPSTCLKALRYFSEHCANAHDNDRCLASFLNLASRSMANQRSSTTEKKSRKKGGTSFLKPIWDLIKRPKSANAAANPSNLNPGSVPSVSGVHDPVQGNDAGTAQPTAAREFLGSISMLLMTTQPLSGRWQCCLASGYVHFTVLDSFLADVAGSTHSPDPTSPTRSARPPLSSDPHLLGSTVGRGEI